MKKIMSFFTKKIVLAVSLALPLLAGTSGAYAGETISDPQYWPVPVNSVQYDAQASVRPNANTGAVVTAPSCVYRGGPKTGVNNC